MLVIRRHHRLAGSEFINQGERIYRVGAETDGMVMLIFGGDGLKSVVTEKWQGKVKFDQPTDIGDVAACAYLIREYLALNIERPHEKPFLVYLAYFTPHRPTQAKSEHVEQSEAKLGPELVQRSPNNAGMIHSLEKKMSVESCDLWTS